MLVKKIFKSDLELHGLYKYMHWDRVVNPSDKLSPGILRRNLPSHFLEFKLDETIQKKA